MASKSLAVAWQLVLSIFWQPLPRHGHHSGHLVMEDAPVGLVNVHFCAGINPTNQRLLMMVWDVWFKVCISVYGLFACMFPKAHLRVLVCVCLSMSVCVCVCAYACVIMRLCVCVCVCLRLCVMLCKYHISMYVMNCMRDISPGCYDMI